MCLTEWQSGIVRLGLETNRSKLYTDNGFPIGRMSILFALLPCSIYLDVDYVLLGATDMKLQATLGAFLVCGLTACGSTVSNTDKPTGVYIAGATEVTGDFGVSTSERRPQVGGMAVSGVSCKNKLWEPAPSNEVAIAVLRREARNAGYNTVYISSVEPDPSALAKNCWAAIIANGVAFNS